MTLDMFRNTSEHTCLTNKHNGYLMLMKVLHLLSTFEKNCLTKQPENLLNNLGNESSIKNIKHSDVHFCLDILNAKNTERNKS